MLTTHLVKWSLILLLFVVLPIALIHLMVDKTLEDKRKDRD